MASYLHELPDHRLKVKKKHHTYLLHVSAPLPHTDLNFTLHAVALNVVYKATLSKSDLTSYIHPRFRVAESELPDYFQTALCTPYKPNPEVWMTNPIRAKNKNWIEITFMANIFGSDKPIALVKLDKVEGERLPLAAWGLRLCEQRNDAVDQIMKVRRRLQVDNRKEVGELRKELEVKTKELEEARALLKNLEDMKEVSGASTEKLKDVGELDGERGKRKELEELVREKRKINGVMERIDGIEDMISPSRFAPDPAKSQEESDSTLISSPENPHKKRKTSSMSQD